MFAVIFQVTLATQSQSARAANSERGEANLREEDLDGAPFDQTRNFVPCTDWQKVRAVSLCFLLLFVFVRFFAYGDGQSARYSMSCIVLKEVSNTGTRCLDRALC